jgi:hypothetical protein
VRYITCYNTCRVCMILLKSCCLLFNARLHCVQPCAA